MVNSPTTHEAINSAQRRVNSHVTSLLPSLLQSNMTNKGQVPTMMNSAMVHEYV